MSGRVGPDGAGLGGARPARGGLNGALVALTALALVAQPAAAQSRALAGVVKRQVTTARLDRHAREITRHERPSGSEGENAAIDYIERTLRAAGVPVEVHELRAYTSDPVSARVSVPGTAFDPPAITMSFSGTGDVEAVAVDIGSLADLPGLELGTGERLVVRDADRFAHVAGRVVIVTGQPRNVPTLVLEQLGALAVIFVNPEERLNDLIVTSTWGTPSLLSYHRLPSLPTAQVTRGAGDLLRARMAEGEVRLRVETEVRQGWRTLRLPVARIEPEGAGSDTPYVLFGGHIDGWYHGATDEGASNAAMLELAIAFHTHRAMLRRGLVVAWWPGHSNARYGGSTWFADRFFDELRRRGVAYLNVDGIGQTGARRFGASTSPAAAGLAVDVIRAGTGEAVDPGRPGRNSDQAFNGIGLPLLQINHTRLAEDGGYWWWHTPEDTYDKIDLQVLETDTELYADAIAAVLADRVLPFDLRAEVAALSEALRLREQESGGALDLSDARRRALDLDAMIVDDGATLVDPPSSAAYDHALMEVIRPIHRVMFAPGGAHHPDPGIYGRPLPGLEPASILAEEDADSDRYGFAMASLVRERNRILEALDRSTAAMRRLLEMRR